MIIRDKFPRTVREIQNIRIPLSDGTNLTARLWLPDDAETNPVPAIIEYIPYRQHDGTAPLDALTHPYFAGHGYAALRVDIRGSGNSEGVLRDEYLEQEQDDALEILIWLEQQSWCTGNAGMIGISWGGFAALQIAARRPPQLKAIITCCSTDDRYTDDVHWMGGCLLNDSVSWGSGLFGGICRPPDAEVVGESWRDMWNARLDIDEVPFVGWIKHQRNDDFWRHGSVCEDYSKIDCAVYAVGGWTDGYSNAIYRLMENLSGPRRALVGPWTHVYPHFGEPGPAIGFLQDALRWWDRWLKDIDTGVEEEPMIQTWMQESWRPHPADPDVGGRWVGISSWPIEQATKKQLWLNHRILSENPGPDETHIIKSPLICGLGGGEWCPRDSGGTGAEFQFDQREDDGRSLCFETEALTERVEVIGEPCLSITLNADQPVAMLAARLCDVAPDGTSSRVTFGLFNLCHRDGSEEPKPVVPGEKMTLTLPLNLVGYAFLPGHRIRLALSNTYWPMAWPSPQHTTLTIHAGKTSLSLPLNDSPQVTERGDPFEVAECSPPLATTEYGNDVNKRTISQDAGSGAVTIFHDEDSGPVLLDDIGLTMRRTLRESFVITEGDPASAETCMARSAEMKRGDWRVKTESTMKVTCDVDNFFINATLNAYECEELIFSRTWDERVPRDHV